MFGHTCNVSDKKDRDKMISAIREKHNGRLDVLVSNVASSTHFGNQLDINEKQYDKMWEVNVKSSFFLI